MRAFLSPNGEIARGPYAIGAVALLLAQYLAVILTAAARGLPQTFDREFWLLPLRRLAELASFTSWAMGLALLFCLLVTFTLAALSLRRAGRAEGGYVLAALVVVPAIQIAAVLLLAISPERPVPQTPQQAADLQDAGAKTSHILQGVLAGCVVIVLAVLLSVTILGLYGWGLFVGMPFLVGIVTAYLANQHTPISPKQTRLLVLIATGLGVLALVMFALEGIVCIVMAAPLGALVAVAGGALGRAAAMRRHGRSYPLTGIAMLPAIFFTEAAMPPALSIAMHETIEIAAPTTMVWQALTSDAPIAVPPGLVAAAGLAYPIRGRLIGEGVGAERLGEFSTGIARERITAWQPGRKLAFTVLTQPPMMREISPYQHVHAPHVSGYFETSATSFELEPLSGGGTRLTARAAHMLRIDPVLYWEPMARWAINTNVMRVLRDIKQKAETPL